MKRWLFFLGLMVWAGVVSAQTFNKTIKKSNLLVFENITSISNGKIIFSGYSNDSILPTKAVFQIGLLDSTGNLEFLKTYSDTALSLFSATNGIIEKNDSIINLLIATGNGNANRPAIIITDLQGNELLRKFYTNSIYWYETPNAIIKTSNAYYLTGTFQRFNGDADVMLMKLGNDFEVLWKKEFGENNKTEIAHSIIELSNGNLLIGAHRTDAGMTVAGQRYKEQTWIFEIDTAGNMVREFLDTNTRTGPAKGLTQTNDGGFVYCGKKQAYWDGHLTHLYENSLTKIDQSLNNIVWEKTFSDTISNLVGLNNIVYSGKNEIIAFGTQPVRFGFTFGYDFSGLIVNYDQNGNKNWERNFRNEDSLNILADNEFFGGTINNTGELIFAGRSEFRNGGPSSGWILKLDSNGCYENGFCGYPVVSVKEKTDYENKDFVFYPNPVKETLFINTQESIEYLKIYNTLGQKVVEQKLPPNQVNLSGLKSGLYFMKVKTAKVVFTKKFVKE